MKLITLHLAYLITFQISINGSSKREEIKKFLEVTKKTSFEFDSALSVAIELLWIELKGSGYVLSKSGARALSFGHWRLIQPTKIESAVLDRFEFGDFLLDKNTYKKRPKVIDLFAGVGGLSLGFESVGFEIVAAMDNDSQACEAHTKNFPMTKVIQDDINKFAKNPKLY